jgi:hypothetical protein
MVMNSSSRRRIRNNHQYHDSPLLTEENNFTEHEEAILPDTKQGIVVIEEIKNNIIDDDLRKGTVPCSLVAVEVEHERSNGSSCSCPLMSLLFYDCSKGCKSRRLSSAKNDKSSFYGDKDNIGNNQSTHRSNEKNKMPSTSDDRNNIGSSCNVSITAKNQTTTKPGRKIRDPSGVVIYGDDHDNVIEGNDDNSSCGINRVNMGWTGFTSWLPSFWDLVLTLYLPIMIQSLFGTFYVARSVLINYGIPYYIVHVSLMIASKVMTTSKLHELLTTTECLPPGNHLDYDNHLTEATSIASSTMTSSNDLTTTAMLGMTSNGKGSPTVAVRIWNNCTPPSFIALLAFITMAAMIVHPDGYTWIIVRRIRYVCYSLQNFCFRYACYVHSVSFGVH